jgi:hypothetical protein
MTSYMAQTTGSLEKFKERLFDRLDKISREFDIKLETYALEMKRIDAL